MIYRNGNLKIEKFEKLKTDFKMDFLTKRQMQYNEKKKKERRYCTKHSKDSNDKKQNNR